MSRRGTPSPKRRPVLVGFPWLRGDEPCLNDDPEKWFASNTGDAVARCRECPTREACLVWAIPNEPYGVWGATTEQERAALRRRQRRSSAAASVA